MKVRELRKIIEKVDEFWLFLFALHLIGIALGLAIGVCLK